jgi:hypothetical protein
MHRYCVNVLQTAAQKKLVTYLQPEMSHEMNLQHNTTGYFQVMVDFLDDNGFEETESAVAMED